MKKRNLKFATALKYNSDEDLAPKLIAKGQGFVAEKILEKASEQDIYIHKDEYLANQLMQLEIQDEIPSELYEVIAQILIFISDLDSNKKNQFF